MTTGPRPPIERLPDDETLMLAQEIAKALNVSRATFYRIPYFRAHKVRRSQHGVGYTKRVYRQYVANGGYQGAV